jgi:hypothetical protein
MTMPEPAQLHGDRYDGSSESQPFEDWVEDVIDALCGLALVVESRRRQDGHLSSDLEEALRETAKVIQGAVETLLVRRPPRSSSTPSSSPARGQ